MRRRLGSVLLAAALLAVIGAGAATRAAAASGVGDPLPKLVLADVDMEKEVDASALLSGSVGALIYMQTSCAACRKEMLSLKDLRAKFPEFKVVVISVDSGGPERVQRYKEHFGFEFPFLHDPEFKTPELFGFSFTPALVLVGTDKKIAALKGGFRPGDEAELESKVAALYGKP